MSRKSSVTKKRQNAREVFSVRFSAAEIKTLRTEADVRGTTLAALVRDVVMGSLDQVTKVMISGASTASGAVARVYGDLARPIYRSEDAA
jgi:hypothetical protein